jgi:D-xylose transport system substrate-binding protein
MRLKLLVPLGLVQERWHHDRKLFIARAKELGADVLLQAAQFNEAELNIQAGNLQTQGVDVLVVVCPNDGHAAPIVEAAHEAGIPVIAYDRLITDCNLDLFISFDNVGVGELQAEYLVERKPKGNYVLIGGCPTDINAKLCRQGQMNILKPYIDRGDILIVEDQWAKDWLPTAAMKIMKNALAKADNQVDAVLASNDGTAGGAIQALAGKKLAGHVLVSGQDADLAACQRIVEGTQSMTVYKPLKLMAAKAAEAAVALALKKPLTEITRTVNNGKKDVPGILFSPVLVDKTNLHQTVIADGFHDKAEIFGENPLTSS